jgi:hypothetical protein
LWLSFPVYTFFDQSKEHTLKGKLSRADLIIKIGFL